LKSLKKWFKDFYPVIKKIAGSPFFPISVNVRQDPAITVGGYYYSSINEIVIKNLSEDVFVHELIHAFRDDYVMGLGTYEEGMTRATEVEAFAQLEKYTHSFDDFHRYHYDVYYEAHNRPNLGTPYGNVQANAALVLLRYQISSYVWKKAYLEDKNFLNRFNDSLYNRVSRDLSTRFTADKLRRIVEDIKPVIEGFPMATWYDRQYVLNTSPAPGYKLYQRISQFTVDYFRRGQFGSEIPQGNARVDWKILDCNDNKLNAGNDDSHASNGWISIVPGLPANYQGKIKVVASAQSPDGEVTDTSYLVRWLTGDRGLHGIVVEANTGEVTVTPLDTNVAAISVALFNGGFVIPAFEKVRGRFRVEYVYPDGFRFSRIFTKERSEYFLWLEKSQSIQASPLPVRFDQFSVVCSGGAKLSWTATAIGQATGYFEIEKQINGGPWSVIGRVNASQADRDVKTYTFTDPGNTQASYRLRYADGLGRPQYSAVHSTRCAGQVNVLRLYPQPVISDLTADLTWENDARADLKIVDAKGATLQKQTVNLVKGRNLLRVNANSLPSGEYIFFISDGARSQSALFIKK
jgi:hypothetical protein